MTYGLGTCDLELRLNCNLNPCSANYWICCCRRCLVTQLCPTLCNPMDWARQAPLSMEFSKQEYWSGLPCWIFPAQELNPGLLHWASLVAQSVKNLPAVQETQVWSLGWEDPLEKEMATHSSIPAWEFHGRRRLVGYSPWGCNSWTRLGDSTQLNSLPYCRQILYHWASREAHLAR